MISSVEPTSKILLGKLQNISREVEKKLSEKVQHEEIENNPFVQGLNNIRFLKLVSEEILQLSFIKDQKERDSFINKQDNLKYCAQLLYVAEINIRWFCKVVQLITEIQTQINETKLSHKYEIIGQLQKLKLIARVFPFVVTFSKEDLFSYDQIDERWLELWQFTQVKVLDAPQKINKQVHKLKKGIQTITALEQVNIEKGYKSELMRMLNMAFGGAFYSIFSNSREKKNIKFKSTLQIDKAKELWNMGEIGIAKYFIKVAYPNIDYMRKFWLSGRAYPMVTEQNILKWKNGQTKKLELEPAPADQVVNKDNIFVEYTNRICVRAMSKKKLERKNDYTDDEQDDYSTIIYHIHGGGFISMSSRSHQTYTRRWAKKCGAAVFSVDYRKAPEAPYPLGLADCWQVYNWLLNESHKFFKIKEKKRIILTGDSAGGNLSFALVNLCIENNVQKPYQIVTFYPATNLSLNTFTPSFLYCFNDPLISFEFLMVCIHSYIPNPEMLPQYDYFISPLVTPDSLLSQYPPIKILVGGKDPLHDDAVRMALRIRHNHVPIELTIYENMIHGFLSLDMPVGMKSAAKCVEDSINIFSEIVKSERA